MNAVFRFKEESRLLEGAAAVEGVSGPPFPGKKESVPAGGLRARRLRAARLFRLLGSSSLVGAVDMDRFRSIGD